MPRVYFGVAGRLRYRGGEGGIPFRRRKQRISIARALIKDAPIVLLDETTSSLDADNEKEIHRALDALMKDKTVIVIAHRLNTIIGRIRFCSGQRNNQ